MARRRKEEELEFEDVSSYSSVHDYKKGRKKRRVKTVLKSIAAFFCVLLILFGSALIYVSTNLISGLSTNAITKDPAELGISTQTVVTDNSIKNIALFGLDTRDNTFRGQSDIIMILTVDNRHKKLKLTSVLRDTRVPVEGYTYGGEYLNWDTKINAAYSYGGPELAIRTLNQNFGLDIEDYVTVNFTNTAKIVDAFGGVEITLTYDEAVQVNENLWSLAAEVEKYRGWDEEEGAAGEVEYSTITKDDFLTDGGGTYMLNGNQAVAYGRNRDDSDDERARRQQRVFKALVTKLKNISFSEYPNLIREMAPLCETSLELDDILALAPILTGGFTVESINIPDYDYENPWGGIAEDEVWYYIYDATEAAKRISSFIWEDASPYWGDYGNTAKPVENTSSH